MVTQHVSDRAQRERDVAEARKHGEFYVEQRSRTFADGPHCVRQFVRHQAICETIRCGQGSVQPVELLMEVVECAERRLVHPFDF
eukprot:3070731-Pleurochrysis_carterae.AAC.1